MNNVKGWEFQVILWADFLIWCDESHFQICQFSTTLSDMGHHVGACGHEKARKVGQDIGLLLMLIGLINCVPIICCTITVQGRKT